MKLLVMLALLITSSAHAAQTASDIAKLRVDISNAIIEKKAEIIILNEKNNILWLESAELNCRLNKFISNASAQLTCTNRTKLKCQKSKVFEFDIYTSVLTEIDGQTVRYECNNFY